jgi:hypothetical protein
MPEASFASSDRAHTTSITYTRAQARGSRDGPHSQPLDATSGVAAPSNAIAPTPQDASVAVGLVDGGVDWHHRPTVFASRLGL